MTGLMSYARAKGMNGGGGVELETESRHENIMKKSEKSITSFQTRIRKVLREIKLTPILFSVLSFACLLQPLVFF